MGYDLSGAAGSMRFNIMLWPMLYELGTRYGWQPKGTEAPDLGPEFGTYDDWRGSYFSNDYQRVTADDAAAWADAVEKSLADVPRHDALESKRVRIGGGTAGIPIETPVNPFEGFSGRRGRAMLREFIAYARAGSFLIG